MSPDPAGIALCKVMGCAVRDLAGNPLHTDRGLIIAADTAKHRAVVALTRLLPAGGDPLP